MNRFIASLQQNLQNELPGDAAHSKVMSYPRVTPIQAIRDGKSPKESAVLILLFPKKNSWYFVLTKRKEYDGVHSKQISLPGGKREEKDQDLLATSLRETQEEIGIDPSSITCLGKLTAIYIPPSNFIVQPYLGFINYTPVFTLEEREVAAAIEVPLARLWHADVLQKTKVKAGKGLKISVPFFDLSGQVVWGATAMILSEFRELYAGEELSF